MSARCGLTGDIVYRRGRSGNIDEVFNMYISCVDKCHGLAPKRRNDHSALCFVFYIQIMTKPVISPKVLLLYVVLGCTTLQARHVPPRFSPPSAAAELFVNMVIPSMAISDEFA